MDNQQKPPMKIRAMTKKEIRQAYGIGSRTLATWLSNIPGLKFRPGKTTYTPREVATIFEHIGNPF